MTSDVVQCVMADRWDREELDAVSKRVTGFRYTRDRLGEFAATGAEAFNDVFWALSKANPTFRDPDDVAVSHRVNLTVLTELAKLSAARRLRHHTVGDPVLAGMACLQLRGALEGIFDRLRAEQEMVRRIVELLRDITGLVQQVEEAEKRFDEAAADAESLGELTDELEELRAARKALEAAQEALSDQEDELTEALEMVAPIVSITLRESVGEVACEVEATAEMARAWGATPGELRRLCAADRMELARKLNTPRMRAIGDQFGRLESIAFGEPTTSEGQPEEMFDLELGATVDRLVPSELMLLGLDATRNEFLARLADHEVLQYALAGEDNVGRGGIVMCVDGSLSMAGPREVFVKAVMLVLLNLARSQRREMHVVHFGSANQYVVFSFRQPGDFAAERIIEAAEVFWASGTDYETPMQVALDLLGEEFNGTGRHTADIVFATDGECEVPPEFMDRYLAEMERMGARTWGVYVGSGDGKRGALSTMTQGRMVSIGDVTSAREIGWVLRGTRGS